jgi:NADH dehydrogenase (ubiquinone) Fe-S protein 1
MNDINGDEMVGLIGEHADIESIVAFKDMMNRLGCENLQFRKQGTPLSPDFRGNYLMNSRITGIDEADVLLVVGSALRSESPVLNARIRKAVVNNGLKVFVVGSTENLTYDFTHLGTTPAVLSDIMAGKSAVAAELENAKTPMILLGGHVLQRADGNAILDTVQGICDKFGVVDPENHWNGFNVLNKDIGQIGALEVGIPASFDAKKKPKLVYLLGADNFKPDGIPEGAFVVY